MLGRVVIVCCLALAPGACGEDQTKSTSDPAVLGPESNSLWFRRLPQLGRCPNSLDAPAILRSPTDLLQWFPTGPSEPLRLDFATDMIVGVGALFGTPGNRLEIVRVLQAGEGIVIEFELYWPQRIGLVVGSACDWIAMRTTASSIATALVKSESYAGKE